MACQGFFTDRYFMYFDFLLSTISPPPQWCHSNFQIRAKKWLITHLWSGTIPGRFLQLLSKHPLSQCLQTSPSPAEAVATE